MAETLSYFGLNITYVLIGLGVASVVVIALYGKFFFSLFEPLSTFAIAQIGDATIMWAIPLAAIYKWQFVAYMFCLWLGFALKSKPPGDAPLIVFDRNSLFDLRFLLGALFLLLVGANLYLGATAGFPLLSANPTEAKFTVYTGGLGFVRRLNMGPYYLFCAGCILLIVTNESRRFAMGILVGATSLVMLGGGKSVLLPMLFVLSFAATHRGICPRIEMRSKIRKYLLLILCLGIAVGLVVTTKEQGGLVSGVQGLVMRLLLAGDGILYYYPRREIVRSLVDPSVFGYLQNVLSDTLGLLRIGSYHDALGSIIMGLEDGTSGPNAQYYLMADIFFGPVIGCLYSFLVGLAIASLRNGFFHARTKSALWLTARLFLALVAFDLAMEAGLFFTEVLVTCIFCLPLYLLARLCRSALGSPLVILGKEESVT